MKEQTLKSWEDFEKELLLINNRTKNLQQENKPSHMEYPLFRGHKNSNLPLKTTLDRIKMGMSLSDYRHILRIVNKSVATCTSRKWDLDAEEPKIHLGGFDLPVSTYEFMAYLRHNEFPSPLLDWTRSPYIAAYFAFGDIYSKAEQVSIFVYRGNIMFGGTPSIRVLGPSIATHRNHYLQQSEYTICVKKQEEETYFANHEDVKDDKEGENVLIQYNIPASERPKFLRKLDSMNVTAYSLFNSEPSLMETLAVREIILKQ